VLAVAGVGVGLAVARSVALMTVFGSCCGQRRLTRLGGPRRPPHSAAAVGRCADLLGFSGRR
jgi:hypothetical protein